MIVLTNASHCHESRGRRIFFLFLCCGAATQLGSWPPHSWGFLEHTQRRTTVGRTPLDEWSARRKDLYLAAHNTYNRLTSMPPVGFELTITAGERPQTYALDRAATGTGLYFCYLSYLFLSSLSVLFSCLPQGIQNVPYDIRNKSCRRRSYNSCNINIILANLIGKGLLVSLSLQQWVWKVWRDLTVTSGPGIESQWSRGSPYLTRPRGSPSLLYKR